MTDKEIKKLVKYIFKKYYFFLWREVPYVLQSLEELGYEIVKKPKKKKR